MSFPSGGSGLRDRLLARNGEDIMGHEQSRVHMAAPSSRRLGSLRDAVLQPPLAVAGTSGGSPAGCGGPTVAAPGGSAPTLGHVRTFDLSGLRLGHVIDPSTLVRQRLAGVAVGHLPRTRVTGSVTVELVATGFSAACRSRYVRRALVSAAVVDRD